MNTVEKLEGYLALVEMWENSYCPERHRPRCVQPSPSWLE